MAAVVTSLADTSSVTSLVLTSRRETSLAESLPLRASLEAPSCSWSASGFEASEAASPPFEMVPPHAPARVAEAAAEAIVRILAAQSLSCLMAKPPAAHGRLGLRPSEMC